MRIRVIIDRDELLAIYFSTRSIHKTAARLGVSSSTVRRRLAKAGVVPYGPKTIDSKRTVKRCHRCKKVKGIEAFHKCASRKDGRSPTCRPCWTEYRYWWYLQRKFGITVADYEATLARQGGGCAICGTKIEMVRKGRRVRFAVDHCHSTDEVRGILCTSCNNGLGRFKDNPDYLEAAAKYLRNHRRANNA